MIRPIETVCVILFPHLYNGRVISLGALFKIYWQAYFKIYAKPELLGMFIIFLANNSAIGKGACGQPILGLK